MKIEKIKFIGKNLFQDLADKNKNFGVMGV